MHRVYELKIVTPERLMFSGEITRASLVAKTGAFGVLGGHAPLVASLVPHTAKFLLPDNSVLTMALGNGVVEISKNQMSILADTAETADEIDV